MSDNKKILALICHPDDELFIAGTLLNYLEAGYQVKVVYFTRGGHGHKSIPVEKLKKIRMDEARNSLRILGVTLEPEFLDYPDDLFVTPEEIRMDIVRIVRKEKPDIIITHSPDDNQRPHQFAAKRIIEAFNIFGDNGRYLHDEFGPAHVRDIYFMCREHSTLLGMRRKPEIFIDITNHIEKIREALLAHKSQLETFQKEFLDENGKVKPNTDPFQLKSYAVQYAMEAWGYLGVSPQNKCKYAEAYTSFARTGHLARKLFPAHE